MVLFILAALTGAAGYGLSKIGSSNLAIMGQGICFLLPIAVIIWVKIRRETKARACRRFKHTSQKVLRTWTAQDMQSHAMQWKIRLRPKSVARPWIIQSRHNHRRRLSALQNDINLQQQQRLQLIRLRQQPQEQELDQLQNFHQLSPEEQLQIQQQFDLQRLQENTHAGATVISMADALQLDDRQTHEDGEGSDIATMHRVSWVDSRQRRDYQYQMDSHIGQPEQDSIQYLRPPSFIQPMLQEAPSSVNSPSPIALLYQTLRTYTQRHRSTTVHSAHTQSNASSQEPDVLAVIADITENNTPNILSTTSTPATNTRGESPSSVHSNGLTIWKIFKESMSGSFCCGFLFAEPKVWLIEISLRECHLDEFTVMAPSPVYCDYRLPGYEDAMAGSIGSITATNLSRTGLNRFRGMPPAYESESESEGEEDDDDDDHDNTDGDNLTSSRIDIQTQGSTGYRLPYPAPVHHPDLGASSLSGSVININSGQPQMEMIQRSSELAPIIILSTPPLTASGITIYPASTPSNEPSSAQEHTHDFCEATRSSCRRLPRYQM
ncbi:hypothetical protein FBU30_010385 [Linnemannia zychae]|nr:hypothetical protein FBU30_010385 [Linnemannia zychae]